MCEEPGFEGGQGATATMSRDEIKAAMDAVTRTPTLEQMAREAMDLPPEWNWFRMQCEGQHPDYWGMTIEGGVAPPKTRGKNAGKPNWRKATLVRKFTATDAQRKAWLRTWEADTGKCHECWGTGWRWAGWNYETGNRYERCRHCDATGLPAALRDAPTPKDTPHV